jgi:hypothetical protein
LLLPYVSRIGAPRIRSPRVRAKTLARWQRQHRLPVGRAAAWCALVFGVLVITVEWNPRKTFVRRVRSIREGMSVDEVEVVMARYMKGAGGQWQVPALVPVVRDADDEPQTAAMAAADAAFAAYREPDYGDRAQRHCFSGTMIYRWSTDARFNADWGCIRYADGRVVAVEFWAD